MRGAEIADFVAGMNIITLASILALAPCAAAAAQETIEDFVGRLTREASSLVKEGKRAEAYALIHKYRADFERASNHEAVAECWCVLANLHAAQRRYRLALPAYDSALANFKRAYPQGHVNIAVMLSNSAVCLTSLGRAEEALKRHEQALRMRRRLGSSELKIAMCLEGIGNSLYALDRDAEALAKLERALETYRRALKPGHPTIANGLHSVGLCLLAMHRLTEARQKFEAAISIERKLYPRGHPLLAIKLGNLANCHFELGEPQAALRNYRESNEMRRRVFSGDHPLIASGMTREAICLSLLGKQLEALPRLEAALEMQRRLFADDSPQVASTLEEVAICMRDLGRPVDALRLLEASLATFRRCHPNNHRTVARSYNALGVCLSQLGRHEDALQKYEAALEIYRQLDASDHRAIGPMMINTASGFATVGRRDEALEMYDRALEMYDAALTSARRQAESSQSGTHHERDKLWISYALSGKAQLLLSIGRGKEAREQSEAALDMCRGLYAGDHRSVAHGLVLFGRCHRSLGKYEAAAAHLKEALAMQERLFGREHPSIALSLTELGRTHLEEDDTVAAVAVLARAISMIESIRRSARTLENADRSSYFRKLRTGNPYRLLRTAYVRSGKVAEALQVSERGRCRGLLDRLEEARFDPMQEAEQAAKQRGDTATAKRISDLRVTLTRSEHELNGVLHQIAKIDANRNLPDAQRAKKQRELEARILPLQSRLRESTRERARLCADFVPLADVAQTSEIRSALADGEVVLFYAIDEHGSHAFVVPARGEIAAIALPAQHETLTKEIEQQLATLSRGTSPARGLKKKTKKTRGERLGRQLGQALVPDALWKRIRDAKRVFLIPDGALSRIPFEALEVGEPKAGKPTYWIDVGPPIAYAASASVLRWVLERSKLQKDDIVARQLVAVADPKFVPDEKETPLPARGALIAKVAPRSQAANIGLRVRDVLLSYDKTELANGKSLRAALRKVEDAIEDGEREEGKIPIKIWRDGKELDFELEAGRIGVVFGRGHARAAWQAGWGRGLENEKKRLVRDGKLRSFGSLLPLPGTRREVSAIARAFAKTDDAQTALASDQLALRFGRDATESELYDLAPRGAFLHLATHGIFDEVGNASFSAIALSLPQAARSNDDGFLELRDLFARWRSRLSSCQMVVLSACRTKVGTAQQDDAVQALPVGFLYAGASSVVASNWNVDDASTAELMADFYKRILAQGEKRDRLKAFTEARRALKKRYPEPFHWAPFVYIGSPR